MIIHSENKRLDDGTEHVITMTFDLEEEAGDRALLMQAGVLIKALEVYAERNAEYKDNWKRMGWRGCLIRVRERSERLWDSLWDAEAPPTDATKWSYKKCDDAIDLINFAAFLCRAVHEDNRDGSWW